MTNFDPFTATLSEAQAQPDADAPHGAVLRWGAAQNVIGRKDYYAQNPLEGVAYCVMSGVVAPDWLAIAFLKQYRKVTHCEVASWDEAFGPAHPPGKHLSTLRLARRYRYQLPAMFSESRSRMEPKLPRTAEGFREAAKKLGITEKQVRTLLPKTRENTRGHKPYSPISTATARANDPFSLAKKEKPKK